MVEQITFQTIFQFLQTIGILVGVYYYIMTIRNTRKNQQLQLETRQAQLFTQLALNLTTTEGLKDYMEVLNWEWEDYHDFEMKYGSDNNQQAYAMRLTLWARFNYVGKLLKEGLISLDLVYTLMTDTPIFQWAKWKDVIEEQRKRYYTSDFMAEWEYLCSELMRYKEELGFSWEPPATLGKYIPDENHPPSDI